MASKLNVLVLLFLIFITQQTFAQKSDEEDLQDAIKFLENNVDTIINKWRNNLGIDVNNLINFYTNFIATNEQIVNGTVSTNIHQIDYVFQVAEKYQRNVFSCTHNEKQQITQIAYDEVNNTKTCMTNRLQDGISAIYNGMSQILQFQDVVDDFKKRVENCHDVDCSKTMVIEINTASYSLLEKSDIILNRTGISLINARTGIDSCMKTYIGPAVFKICRMVSDVTQCIAKMLGYNEVL